MINLAIAPAEPVPYGFMPIFAGRTSKQDRAVLVVEDDANVLSMISEALTTLGHDVVAARDAYEAMRHLHNNPAIGYLFTDVAMPYGMSGVDLMLAARALRPDLQAMLTSSYSLDEVARMGVIPDEVAFIPKPYSPVTISVRLWRGWRGRDSAARPGTRRGTRGGQGFDGAVEDVVQIGPAVRKPGSYLN
jgi:CheY-like chemotaxis protein